MPETVYQPLLGVDSFRVLVLEPGHEENPIRCRLEPTNLATHHPFEAISYFWGNPKPSRSIHVNAKSFEIGENLFQVLHHFRLPAQDRILWADAICINQKDIPERNQQVQIVRQIYEASQNTLIWLKGYTESDRMVLDMFQQCEIILRDETHSDQTRRQTIAASFFSPGFYLEREASVKALYAVNWFKRAWVQQEFIVSPKVTFVCGKYHIVSEAADLLIAAILNSKDNGPHRSDSTFLNDLLHAKRMISMREGHTSDGSLELSFLIRRIHGSSTASDPKDSIFALLGLVRSKTQVEMQADYKLSVSEVFTMAVKHCCSEGNLLPILGIVATYPRGELRASLPSWVPDLNSHSRGIGRFRSSSFSQLVGMVQSQHLNHALRLMILS